MCLLSISAPASNIKYVIRYLNIKSTIILFKISRIYNQYLKTAKSSKAQEFDFV